MSLLNALLGASMCFWRMSARSRSHAFFSDGDVSDSCSWSSTSVVALRYRSATRLRQNPILFQYYKHLQGPTAVACQRVLIANLRSLTLSRLVKGLDLLISFPILSWPRFKSPILPLRSSYYRLSFAEASFLTMPVEFARASITVSEMDDGTPASPTSFFVPQTTILVI